MHTRVFPLGFLAVLVHIPSTGVAKQRMENVFPGGAEAYRFFFFDDCFATVFSTETHGDVFSSKH